MIFWVTACERENDKEKTRGFIAAQHWYGCETGAIWVIVGWKGLPILKPSQVFPPKKMKKCGWMPCLRTVQKCDTDTSILDTASLAERLTSTRNKSAALFYLRQEVYVFEDVLAQSLAGPGPEMSSAIFHRSWEKRIGPKHRNPCMFGDFFGRRFGCLLSSFFQAKECPSITSHAAFEKGCLGEIWNVWMT